MESPPADVLAWTEAVVGDRVIGVQSMVGGIDAHMFRLSLADGADIVLRVTMPGDHDDVAYQAQVLDLLATTAVPAPRAIAHAAGIGPAAHRVLLQTLLPGDP